MVRRMLFGSGTWRALGIACLALVAATASIAPQIAHAQANPLARAQQQYAAGNFADALTTVQNALESGAVTGSDALTARQLLGRCQAKIGDVAGARRTFLQILRQDPQFRLDEATTPPDELAVFRQALRTFEAEQTEARQRIPASVSLFYGMGSGANEDFGEYVAAGGGDKKFENKPMFGLGVRFPIRPRWSLDLEVTRFRATNHDGLAEPYRGEYELSAIPVVVSLYFLVSDVGKVRASVFAGGGPMLNSYAADRFNYGGFIPISVSDTKIGTYFHGGAEGEYMLHPKLSLAARALLRSAKATKMFKGSTFGDPEQYSGTGAVIGNRDLDFSGFGLSLALRGYIGY